MDLPTFFIQSFFLSLRVLGVDPILVEILLLARSILALLRTYRTLRSVACTYYLRILKSGVPRKNETPQIPGQRPMHKPPGAQLTTPQKVSMAAIPRSPAPPSDLHGLYSLPNGLSNPNEALGDGQGYSKKSI